MGLTCNSLKIAVLFAVAVYLCDCQFTSEVDEEDMTSISTNLNLSPWELYVMTDLIFKLTTKRCPKIPREAMTSLKDALSETFKHAPRVEVQNEDFLPVYNKLVKCIDNMEAMDGKTGEKTVVEVSRNSHSESHKKDQKKMEVVEVEISEETEWKMVDPTTTTEAPEGIFIVSDSDPSGSWIWGITHWFSDAFRSKRDLEKEEAEKSQKQKEKDIKKEEERRRQLNYNRSRQSFANLFHVMSKIVRKTCPLMFRPEKAFLRKALLDMATWLTVNEQEAIDFANEYFNKLGLGKSIQQCYHNL